MQNKAARSCTANALLPGTVFSFMLVLFPRIIAVGISMRTLIDFGTQLEKHELKGSSGTVNVKETTNGDYYYCDSEGVGYTDNGDGTWTDENGNLYEE